ncbi:phosphatidylserine decarboxylase [bacterium BMS3Abin14]|nr:phosphatidylserine decarboxylase [bacterium BMS3Abin14]
MDKGRTIIGVASEGLKPAGLIAAGAVVLFAIGFSVAGIFFLAGSVAVLLFFRDPERKTQARPGDIFSPADGRVVAVGPVAEERYLKGPAMRISVFMSIFNVHINRIPLPGRVLEVKHLPGGFRMAHLDEASLQNERTEILMEDPSGRRALMVQVAGLVARRIICRLVSGERVETGRRFGLICFGSRVDLYLPPETASAVNVGDRVRAGLSVVGRLESNG